jgi:hypothetical protein
MRSRRRRSSSQPSQPQRPARECRTLLELRQNPDCPGGELPASQAAIPTRSDHTNGLGQNPPKLHGYNARAAPTVEQPILATASPWPPDPLVLFARQQGYRVDELIQIIDEVG